MYKEYSNFLCQSTMATAVLVGSPSTADTQHADFLTYLRNKFNDEEANAFFSTFALVFQGKINEFCIDFDEAYHWMGFSRKDNALRLMLQTLKLKNEQDFILLGSEEQRNSDKYMLKPTSLKKLLLAARTEKAKKAAEYFIKIEEAIPEFCYNINNVFSSQLCNPDANIMLKLWIPV